MLVLIFLACVAGVFSFLSPCTLPILPAYFAVTAQADRARMGFMSVAFFLGLATLFVGMGASASFFGGLLREYMFSLATVGGVIVIVFGIMTLFGKGFSGAGFQGRPASTFFGFFLFGCGDESQLIFELSRVVSTGGVGRSVVSFRCLPGRVVRRLRGR